MSISPTANLVFQGEMKVVKEEEGQIVTVRPHTCTVFSLFDAEKKITVLAHIDDYTSVTDAFKKLEKTLIEQGTTLKECNFKAKVLGGTKETFSVQQQVAVLTALKSHDISFERIQLNESKDERPQVKVDTSSGELHLLKDKEIDWRLEKLQIHEYGAFNDFLDAKYGELDGKDVPDFQIKKATRTMRDIRFQLDVTHPSQLKAASIQWVVDGSSSITNLADILSRFKLPIQPERKEIEKAPVAKKGKSGGSSSKSKK